MITLCKTCGTSYKTAGSHPAHCPICEDERQYIHAFYPFACSIMICTGERFPPAFESNVEVLGR